MFYVSKFMVSSLNQCAQVILQNDIFLHSIIQFPYTVTFLLSTIILRIVKCTSPVHRLRIIVANNL